MQPDGEAGDASVTDRESRLPEWVRALHGAHVYLGQNFLGGPRVVKLAWLINVCKGSTFVVVGLLMLAYGNYSVEAWVYLGLHGSYGLCWLLKDASFPDRQWERKVTVGGAFMAFVLVLGPYWLFPFLLISDVLGPARSVPGNWILGGAIALHTIGMALMLGADAQKHYTLKYRPGLIQEGLFRHVRHPNYLGEMLIYAAYALLVHHWIPWVILGWVWVGVFLVNMQVKEASLARYPEWAAYKARTGMLWPRLLGSGDRKRRRTGKTDAQEQTRR